MEDTGDTSKSLKMIEFKKLGTVTKKANKSYAPTKMVEATNQISSTRRLGWPKVIAKLIFPTMTSWASKQMTLLEQSTGS